MKYVEPTLYSRHWNIRVTNLKKKEGIAGKFITFWIACLRLWGLKYYSLKNAGCRAKEHRKKGCLFARRIIMQKEKWMKMSPCGKKYFTRRHWARVEDRKQLGSKTGRWFQATKRFTSKASITLNKRTNKKETSSFIVLQLELHLLKLLLVVIKFLCTRNSPSIKVTNSTKSSHRRWGG